LGDICSISEEEGQQQRDMVVIFGIGLMFHTMNLAQMYSLCNREHGFSPIMKITTKNWSAKYADLKGHEVNKVNK
jgi:hypothetical protein